MLSLSAQLRLKKVLLPLSKHEQEIENLRQKLSSYEDFEPYSAYRLVDTLNKKQITIDDILHLFRLESNLSVNEKDCETFIKIFDFEGKGFLNIHNFNHCILPRNNSDLREYVSMKPIQDDLLKSGKPQICEMVHLIMSLIHKEIQFYNKVHRKNLLTLRKKSDFNLKSAFATLQYSSIEEYITFRSLQRFFKRNGFYASPEDSLAIIHRLDIDYDLALVFEEFIKGMMLFEVDEYLLKQENVEAIYSAREYKSPLQKTYLSLGKENLENIISARKQSIPMKDQFLGHSHAPGIGPPTQQLRSKHSLLSLEELKVPDTYRTTNMVSSHRESKFSPHASYMSQVQEEERKRGKITKFPVVSQTSQMLNSKAIMNNAKRSRLDEEMLVIFKKQMELEVYLEKAKQRLALKVDFNLNDLFCFLDTIDKGFIELFDIQQICQYLRVGQGTENQMKLFIERFDQDGDQKLLFTDIGIAFLSCDKNYQDLVVGRSPYYSQIVKNKEQIFAFDTQKLIGQLLKFYFYIEDKHQKLRQEVFEKEKEYFDIHFAFENLDFNRDGFLDINDVIIYINIYQQLNKFFETSKDNKVITQKEIDLLFKRYDRLCKGKVSFSELKLFTHISQLKRKDNIVYDRPEISAFEHFLGEFSGLHKQFHYYETNGEDSPVSPTEVFFREQSSSDEASSVATDGSPIRKKQIAGIPVPFASGLLVKKKKKKIKYHSDFYFKLKGLNKKIKLYKKVFYSKQPKYIHSKEEAKFHIFNSARKLNTNMRKSSLSKPRMSQYRKRNSISTTNSPTMRNKGQPTTLLLTVKATQQYKSMTNRSGNSTIQSNANSTRKMSNQLNTQNEDKQKSVNLQVSPQIVDQANKKEIVVNTDQDIVFETQLHIDERSPKNVIRRPKLVPKQLKALNERLNQPKHGQPITRNAQNPLKTQNYDIFSYFPSESKPSIFEKSISQKEIGIVVPHHKSQGSDTLDNKKAQSPQYKVKKSQSNVVLPKLVKKKIQEQNQQVVSQSFRTFIEDVKKNKCLNQQNFLPRQEDNIKVRVKKVKQLTPQQEPDHDSIKQIQTQSISDYNSILLQQLMIERKPQKSTIVPSLTHNSVQSSILNDYNSHKPFIKSHNQRSQKNFKKITPLHTEYTQPGINLATIYPFGNRTILSNKSKRDLNEQTLTPLLNDLRAQKNYFNTKKKSKAPDTFDLMII